MFQNRSSMLKMQSWNKWFVSVFWNWCWSRDVETLLWNPHPTHLCIYCSLPNSIVKRGVCISNVFHQTVCGDRERSRTRVKEKHWESERSRVGGRDRDRERERDRGRGERPWEREGGRLMFCFYVPLITRRITNFNKIKKKTCSVFSWVSHFMALSQKMINTPLRSMAGFFNCFVFIFFCGSVLIKL